MKKIYITLFVAVTLGCSGTETEFVCDPFSLDFDTRSVSSGLMSNMRLFLFDGDDRNNANSQFYKELFNTSYSDDKITVSMESGLWNIALVSCEYGTLNPLVAPIRGFAPRDLLMWKTVPVDGVLPDTPDIRTDLLDGVHIAANASLKKHASLDRHVGMVRVCLTDGVGFNTGSGHVVYLKNVPTSLSWGGSLYPNKTTPDHSGNISMNGSLTFVNTGNGRQKSSDMVDFIVPAHKSTEENDTTTHKLVLGVKFNTISNTLFEKEITINRVPRDNKIVQVNLSAKGGVEVATEIVDWNLENSTISPDLYTMQADGYDSSSGEWVYRITMHQERNWWVALAGADSDCFEFVDTTASSGQQGVTTIRVKHRNPSSGCRATLSLYISGYAHAVESWEIQS